MPFEITLKTVEYDIPAGKILRCEHCKEDQLQLPKSILYMFSEEKIILPVSITESYEFTYTRSLLVKTICAGCGKVNYYPLYLWQKPAVPLETEEKE